MCRIDVRTWLYMYVTPVFEVKCRSFYEVCFRISRYQCLQVYTWIHAQVILCHMHASTRCALKPTLRHFVPAAAFLRQHASLID